jgi:hypothetical protein
VHVCEWGREGDFGCKDLRAVVVGLTRYWLALGVPVVVRHEGQIRDVLQRSCRRTPFRQSNCDGCE